MDRYITKVLFYAQHVKFEQVLGFLSSPRKKSKILFLQKKSSKTHKECLNKCFWPKIPITNTLGTSVHRMYKCEKNQVPYCNVKISKSEISENFGPLIKHGPHWINVIIFIFISENNRYSKCLYKIWNKIISFDMRGKKIKERS